MVYFMLYITLIKRLLIIFQIILPIFFFLSFSYAKQLNYKTISNLPQIKDYIGNFNKKDLVVFDIDGVIITPTDKILKSSNREIRHSYFNKLEQELGKEQFLNLFEKIVIQLNAEFVEEKFPEFFYHIKSYGSKVIALTLMGPNNPYIDQEKDRVHLLRKMGIIFDDIYKNSNIVLENNKDRPQPLAISGILFSRGYNKGKVLSKLLNNIAFKPNRIIFIDDKIEHAQSFNANFQQSNIKVFSFLYNPVQMNQEINQCVVDKQFDWAKRHSIWLSDRQAYILCNEDNEH